MVLPDHYEGEDVIKKAKVSGKFLELSMNIEIEE